MHSSKKRPQRQIVYIDGENFLHRVSEILKSKKLISSKLEITTFNFRGLFESVLDEKNLKIQYSELELNQLVTATRNSSNMLQTLYLRKENSKDA